MRISDWSSDVCSSDLVDDRVVADEGAGVGRGTPCGQLAGADLEADERLAGTGRSQGRAPEGLRVADGLQEQRDRLRRLVVDEEVDDVCRIDHCLVAERDHVGEPEDRKSTRLNSSL